MSEFNFPGDRMIEQLIPILGSKEEAEKYYHENGFEASQALVGRHLLGRVVDILKKSQNTN